MGPINDSANAVSSHFGYGEHTIRPNASDEHFTLLDALFSCVCEPGSVIGMAFSTDTEYVKYNPPIIMIVKIIITIPINIA